MRKYVNEWIVAITDITGYVKDLREQKSRGTDIRPLLPEEKHFQTIDWYACRARKRCKYEKKQVIL